VSLGSAYGDGSVLVTGAEGFVGSWLVERLLADGARVVAPLRPVPDESRFRRERLDERCELVSLDLLDLPDVVRVLNERDVALAFHLAARTIVADAKDDPIGAFDVNVRGTYNLLEAARLLGRPDGGPRIVVASSYHAYGRQGTGAYTEATPLRPSFPYDVSKACADILARGYAGTYRMPVAVTRMANIYGGGDLNWSRIVPDAARALVRGERPVIASDGTPERDYLFVEDATDAYLAIAASLEDPALRGRAWNAGLDRPVSVLEVVETLIAGSGKDVEPEILGRASPLGQADSQYLDSSAIREELGWSPTWDLVRGLRATYGWYEANLA
jgi:CDP-glucose 4,6-dehydratase